MISTQETQVAFSQSPEVLSGISETDVEDFARLLGQLSSTPRTEEEVAQNLNQVVNSATSRIFVVRGEDGRICATATGNTCPIPTGNKAWVDDVVTDADHRGRGYGRAVTLAVEGWFSELGLKASNLTSRPARADAGDLYVDMGYNERDTRVYRKSLSGAVAVSTVVARP